MQLEDTFIFKCGNIDTSNNEDSEMPQLNQGAKEVLHKNKQTTKLILGLLTYDGCDISMYLD